MAIDKFGCLGSTIKVAAGHYVDLLNPTADSIDIYSIASALGKICRFGGHCPKFYSVAEHSCWAYTLAVRENQSSDVCRAVLLHDSAEAYVGDIVKPLKVLLPEYAEIERRFEAAIAERFGVDFDRHKDAIKRYDRMMLQVEKQAMWPEDREHWEGFGSEIPGRVLLQMKSPVIATQVFLVLARNSGIGHGWRYVSDQWIDDSKNSTKV